jgi:hypothetical protein
MTRGACVMGHGSQETLYQLPLLTDSSGLHFD